MQDNTRNWDGGWTNSQGHNIYPYKGDEKPVHNPMDYESHDINSEVA